MMSAKLVTSGLLQIKAFRNEAYDGIILVYDVTNKILSRDSIYIVDLAFSVSSVSMREVIKTSIS